MGFFDNLRKEISELSQALDKQLASADERLQAEQKNAAEELEKLENYIKEKATELRTTTQSRYEEVEKFALDKVADAKKAVNADWDDEIKKKFDEAYKLSNTKLDELKQEIAKKTGISEDTVKAKLADLQKTFNENALSTINHLEETLAKAKQNLQPPGGTTTEAAKPAEPEAKPEDKQA